MFHCIEQVNRLSCTLSSIILFPSGSIRFLIQLLIVSIGLLSVRFSQPPVSATDNFKVLVLSPKETQALNYSNRFGYIFVTKSGLVSWKLMFSDPNNVRHHIWCFQCQNSVLSVRSTTSIDVSITLDNFSHNRAIKCFRIKN